MDEDEAVTEVAVEVAVEVVTEVDEDSVVVEVVPAALVEDEVPPVVAEVDSAVQVPKMLVLTPTTRGHSQLLVPNLSSNRSGHVKDLLELEQ